MVLGIGVAVLLLVTVVYASWLIRQCLCPRSTIRRREKRAYRLARMEDREDRAFPLPDSVAAEPPDRRPYTVFPINSRGLEVSLDS